MKPAPRALVTSAVAAAVGCGVSFQSVYEGDVRFEHCYRLDSDGRISSPYRTRCWREWLDHYTYGQTRDRVDYARRRVHEMESGVEEPMLRPDPAEGGLPPAATAAPAPTSPHAPPPRLAAPAASSAGPSPATVQDAGADASVDATAPAPPRMACVEPCTRAWRGCSTAACGDGGPACRKCDSEYRACMRRCFR